MRKYLPIIQFAIDKGKENVIMPITIKKTKDMYEVFAKVKNEQKSKVVKAENGCVDYQLADGTLLEKAE